MPHLVIGLTISHFTITAKLGEGGMGEVYRAEDTKLGRNVAIKVLPEDVAGDPERLARFEREAKVLASLNHSNIAGIYSFESAWARNDSTLHRAQPEPPLAERGEGSEHPVHFLVMELVEGEDLKERMDRGPISLEEALPIALQMARALEAAHECGVVHRDLKPANVKIAPGGEVKVLDFGLAKALDPASDGEGGSDVTHVSASLSPTLTAQMTKAGVILGTAAYMSPEQARGRSADRRADIWSFGVVVFEMLTGAKVFAGDTVSDVLAAVLRADLELESLPAETPESLKRMLSRCLQRDPAQRLQHMGDARLDIEEAIASEGTGVVETADAEGTGSRIKMLMTGVAAAALGALVTFLVLGGRSKTVSDSNRPPRQLSIAAQGRQLRDTQAISPDGASVAFTAAGKMWLRSLAEPEAREVVNSEGAEQPFWSPDGEFVGYAAAGAIWKVDVRGGTPLKLCDLPGGEFAGGTWGPDGRILIGHSTGGWSGDIKQVPEAGGHLEPYLTPVRDEGYLKFSQPQWTPEAELLLFLGLNSAIDVELLAQRGETLSRLQTIESNAGIVDVAYANEGLVVLAAGGDEIWGLPIDSSTLESTGDLVRISADAQGPSVASDGTLLYSRIFPEGQQLAWITRQGEVLERIGEVGEELTYPMIAPDGSRAVFSVNTKQGGDLWLLEFNRGAISRLTHDGGASPSWAPDSRSLAYINMNHPGLFFKRIGDSGPPRMIADQDKIYSPHISADGKWVVYYAVAEETARDLWYASLEAESEPLLFLQTPFNENVPRFSPDGRYLAYQSDETGRYEIYVRPFPEGEGLWQISVASGQIPQWSSDGSELYYLEGNSLMVADIAEGPEFQVSRPRKLLDGESLGTDLLPPGNFFAPRYDVAPDGQHFLVVLGVEQGTSRMVLVDNGLPN